MSDSAAGDPAADEPTADGTPLDPRAADGTPLRSRRGRAILAATILASSMAFLDGTITSVATARIGRDFSASFGSLQWVVNAYTLPLAALILLGGALGDRLGRRRILMLGIAWFAGASLLCALAPTMPLLIAARAVQGAGAALMTPASLSIISSAIARPDRARAIGAWSGLSGVSTALGPLVGGWLVQHASWRWAFAINLPLAAAAIVFARGIPPNATRTREPLDVGGVLLTVAGLGALTWGLTEAGSSGWGAAPAIAAGAGLLALATFVALQRRSAHPVVPLRLFADRTFSGANLMTFATYGSMGAAFFVLPIALQTASGYGPLAAGLATLPVTILLLALSPMSGQLSARIGPRLQLTAGPALAAIGCLLLLRVRAGRVSYLADVLPGVAVFGLGLATLVAPLTAAVMGAAPDALAGAAPGINNAAARAASLLAVAVIPAAAGLSGAAYLDPDRMADGYRVAMVICAAVLACGGAADAVLIPRPGTATRAAETT